MKLQIAIGTVLIVGGLTAWWTGYDTQAALGLLATATGVGQIAVAWIRHRRKPNKPPPPQAPMQQLTL